MVDTRIIKCPHDHNSGKAQKSLRTQPPEKGSGAFRPRMPVPFLRSGMAYSLPCADRQVCPGRASHVPFAGRSGHTERMESETTEIVTDKITENHLGGCRGCRTPVAPPAATPSAVYQAFSLLFSGGVAGVAGDSATIAPRACVCTCACTYSGLRSAATPATPGGSKVRFRRFKASATRPGRRGCLPPQPRHPRHPVAAGGGQDV